MEFSTCVHKVLSWKGDWSCTLREPQCDNVSGKPLHMQGFNEAEWIKLVFLLADTQSWVDDLCRDCFAQLPLDKKKLFKKDYYLTATTMAHIIERHYYKVNRHPQAGKFHIPLAEILEHIRAAYAVVAVPMDGSCNFCRVMDTGGIIGYDKEGKPAGRIAVITDKGGRIVTAFPCVETVFAK